MPCSCMIVLQLIVTGHFIANIINGLCFIVFKSCAKISKASFSNNLPKFNFMYF